MVFIVKHRIFRLNGLFAIQVPANVELLSKSEHYI